MERIVIIDKVLEKTTVTSKNGSFVVQPVLLSETEKKVTASGAEFENKQSYLVDVVGGQAAKFALKEGTKVRVNLVFYTYEYKGKCYLSAKTYFIQPVND